MVTLTRRVMMMLLRLVSALSPDTNNEGSTRDDANHYLVAIQVDHCLLIIVEDCRDCFSGMRQTQARRFAMDSFTRSLSRLSLDVLFGQRTTIELNTHLVRQMRERWLCSDDQLSWITVTHCRESLSFGHFHLLRDDR